MASNLSNADSLPNGSHQKERAEPFVSGPVFPLVSRWDECLLSILINLQMKILLSRRLCGGNKCKFPTRPINPPAPEPPLTDEEPWRTTQGNGWELERSGTHLRHRSSMHHLCEFGSSAPYKAFPGITFSEPETFSGSVPERFSLTRIAGACLPWQLWPGPHHPEKRRHEHTNGDKT